MEDLTVTVQGETWKPTVPRSAALVDDLVTLGAYNVQRAYAAALVATWGGKRRPKVSYRQCGHNPGDFGGKCWDALRERGVKREDILLQGGLAYAALLDSFAIDEKEVAETEGFTEAAEAVDVSSP